MRTREANTLLFFYIWNKHGQIEDILFTDYLLSWEENNNGIWERNQYLLSTFCDLVPMFCFVLFYQWEIWGFEK